MEVSRAIDLIDDKMCWGRGTFSAHHMPEYDEYWQALEIKGDISDIFLTVLIGLACPLLLPLVIKKIEIEDESEEDNNQ